MIENVEIVLFDMGRVLVRIDFDAFPNALGLVTQEQRAPFYKATMEAEKLYECGKISTGEFLDAQYEIFEKRFSHEDILSAYNAIIVEEHSEIIPVVEKIQAHYKTALLSNTSETHWKKSLAVAPILQTIPKKFLSFQIGAMKPAPKVYESVIQALNVKASSILFIDDVQENINGAQTAGMQSILFTTVKKLEEQINTILF